METRIAEIERVEGDQRASMMGEALVEVSDPEVLGALIRIAQLAPQIEYAVQAVAAGPVLIDETLESIRQQLGPHDDKIRLQAAVDLAQAASDRPTLMAATKVVEQLPHLAPALTALSEAMAQRSAVDGDELTDEIREAVLKVTDPEVVATLGRLAELAPSIEYAAYFAAAGPELLQDNLDWLREVGHGESLARLQRLAGEPGFLDETVSTIEALVKHQPQLRRLLDLVDVIPDETQLRTLLETLPKLAAVADNVDVDVINDVLEVMHDETTLPLVRAVQSAVNEASATSSEVGLWGLLGAMSDPEVKRTVGFGLDVSKAFAKHLRQLPVAQSK
ncbi:MAG: DUF1641 domain-containing protein [Myxococcota bacterium]